MQQVSKSEGGGTMTAPLDELTESRRRIDKTITDLSEDEDLTHQELIEVLAAARDALLVRGHIPDWYGDAESVHYQEMVWGHR